MRTFTILVLALALAGSAWAVAPDAANHSLPGMTGDNNAAAQKGSSLNGNDNLKTNQASRPPVIHPFFQKVRTITGPVLPSGGAYQGLAFDGDSTLYWVRGQNSMVALVVKINKNSGAVLDSFNVNINGFPIGMTYQGGALWLGQFYPSSQIHRVDLSGNILRSFAPGGVTGTNLRGVSWSTTGNHFYLTHTGGAVNAGGFVEEDTLGAIVRTVPFGSTVNWGMAGDTRTRGDSVVLWISDDDVNQDLRTINVTGASATQDTIYDVRADFPLGVYTGGSCYDGRYLYVGQVVGNLIQVYDLAQFNHDVGVSAIRSPIANETPNSSVTPQVVYRNQGTSPETNITVGCFVDSSGITIYRDSSTVASMAAGDTASISFPNWTVGPAGATYTFTSWNRLAGDLNSVNDTMRLTVTAFPMLTTLVAPKGTAPTIDGVINTSEWADANKYDISDVLGNGGGDPGGSPPGSAFLYLKNDSANLYVAVDNNVGSSADYDQVGLYFDDNRDRAWAADSSEGNFWWAYVGAGNRTIYRSIPDYTMNEPVPGMTWAISTSSGHQQYEGLVQIGLKPPNPNYFLNSVVGDTVGFYTYSQFNGAVQRGWWPQALPGTAWNDPSQYGDLVLLNTGSGVESPGPVKLPAKAELFASTPNPTAAGATIRFALPARAEVSLKLYDIQGRLVRTLASGTREAGVHSVSLEGGSLSSGVYFYRLQAANFTATKKLVIAR